MISLTSTESSRSTDPVGGGKRPHPETGTNEKDNNV